MEQHEQERFDQLYAQHVQALTLQGKRGKTIDGYARAVRRVKRHPELVLRRHEIWPTL